MDRRAPEVWFGWRATVTVLAAALCVVGACGLRGEPGSGQPKRETRPGEPFRAISLGGAFDAEISVAASQTVEVSGDNNLVPLITTEVKDGRLFVKTTKPIRPKLPLLVRITSPEVRALSLSGA